MIDEQPWPFLLVGIAMMVPLVVQIVVFIRNQRRNKTWLPVTATITNTKVEKDSDGGRTYYAVYVYTAPDGTTNHTGRTKLYRQPTTGQLLAVVVDPEDYDRNQLYRRVGWGHWLAGIGGFFFFAVGLFGVIQSLHIIVTGEMLVD